jgi:hypothetical protein
MAGRFIEVENLGKQYEGAAPGTPPALQSVSLAIAQGEFVAVMGPSGSGKSTFMNIIGLLDAPTEGAYRLNGENVAGLSTDELAHVRNRVFGFVFQGFNLLKRITAAENVALPMVYSGIPGGERRRRARELLAKLGLAAYPSRGQPWEAQRWDDYECWVWAQQNTGIDPTAPPPPPPDSDGSAVAMGAAVGALSGAFLGGFWQNPWAGMAAGAMAGAAGGAVADEQRRAQAAAQAQGARLDQFRRAYAACMEGRGYTVR